MSFYTLDTRAMTNNHLDKNDVFPYGSALETQGLANVSAVNGFGLVTNGFLWQGHSVWGPDANSLIVTVWVNSQYGLFGEYPPTIP